MKTGKVKWFDDAKGFGFRAERLSDRIGIMNRGKIAAIGAPRELQGALGEHASLEDVFERYTSDEAVMQGAYDPSSYLRRCAPACRTPRPPGSTASMRRRRSGHRTGAPDREFR